MIQKIEKIADRKSWLAIALFSIISMAVLVTTQLMEIENSPSLKQISSLVITEGTSHFMTIVAALLIPFWLSRFPVSTENWMQRIPAYLLCFLLFSLFHILGMMLLRKLLFMLFWDHNYAADLLSWRTWVYEMRKDLMTFILVMGTFLTFRNFASLRQEAEAARHDAKETGRIVLKSGGRSLFMQADEITYAKAAGNYIEVFTRDGMHMVRMTMSALEALLGAAGQHVRVHRSYIVHKNSVSEMTPNGDGEAMIYITNEIPIPVSRKYRKSTEILLQSN